MQNDHFFNLFDENLKIVSHCPVCGSSYSPLEARVLAEKSDAHLVHIRCRTCQTAVLAVIMSSSIGVSSIGLITDLSSDDVLKFQDAAPVTTDDVIELHQLLTREKALIDKLT
ncbi:MAG: hypothetical protein A2951_01155 [Candidatus Buchananbacteria bacterium RIFCSPLOWO2_01_FULL_56_15]|uniref:Uncharacterized protein n=2 Tax=Candidatus Buchananiibacteriota TaxID=1817903 RepID=A0A1G1YL86_9BACT|nr:MAG: hypothetical protein A3J59_04435 [Candidatus Buchananbacteria bacterium RIFCSPHIGHO2_02_FULL_56_16]OGY54669.1 MAG: hypothetical protein A2951_01155 [Candidatus Buchananbacteria bacterium RIFCSPLOWO2_01_FULL_56_15]